MRARLLFLAAAPLGRFVNKRSVFAFSTKKQGDGSPLGTLGGGKDSDTELGLLTDRAGRRFGGKVSRIGELNRLSEAVADERRGRAFVVLVPFFWGAWGCFLDLVQVLNLAEKWIREK